MTNETALVNIGDLAKPATTLIERVSDAIGGVFKPFQIRRVAEAEADAMITTAKAEIEITDLQHRAFRRFLTEEAKKQANLEAITAKAIPSLGEESEPQNIEEDWLVNFLDKARLISDEEMQELWARVLAGEANSKGTFSTRTINFLSSIDKRDAQIFTTFCRFCWSSGRVIPFIYDVGDEIYSNNGLVFDGLSHLDALGLISFMSIGEYSITVFDELITLKYFGETVTISLRSKGDSLHKLQLGKAIFTQLGNELAPLVGTTPIPGFFDYVVGEWTKKGYAPSRTSVTIP